MSLDSCDPCACIPGYISTDSFYQKILLALCNIYKLAPGAVGGLSLLSIPGQVTTSGNNQILAADASNAIYVTGYKMTTDSSTKVTAKFTAGNGGTEKDRTTMQAPASVTTGITEAVPAPAYLFKIPVNTALVLNLSVNANIDYTVYYYKAP